MMMMIILFFDSITLVYAAAAAASAANVTSRTTTSHECFGNISFSAETSTYNYNIDECIYRDGKNKKKKIIKIMSVSG